MNSAEISKELERLASEYTEKLGPIIAQAVAHGAVAGLLMSLIDADAVQKWADSDRVEEYVEPYDTMSKKVARAAYLDGVRDYARFVNGQLGITIARVEDGE